MIAAGLVEAGVRVFICSRNAEACALVAQQQSEIGWCEAIPADLSCYEGCVTSVTELKNRTVRCTPHTYSFFASKAGLDHLTAVVARGLALGGHGERNRAGS